MIYRGITPKEEIRIEQLYSLHYYEYMNEFYFPGESHDFWELVYMDKGEMDVWGGDRKYTLQRGDIIFHKPNEFHGLQVSDNAAPNVMVISFSCHSPAIHFFSGKSFHLNDRERAILGLILFEARSCFPGSLPNPYLEEIERNAAPGSPLFGSEQLILLYLEQLLILIQRRHLTQDTSVDRNRLPMPVYPTGRFTRKKSDSELYDRIVNYMMQHVDANLTIEQICHDNLVGRSQLQKLFQEQNHCGIIYFFSCLKIDAAKQYIRSGQMNFTQISELLGYSTVHYFSRQFKRITGMTPSEYASSVKGLSEQDP